MVTKTTSWSVKRACMVAPATITTLALPNDQYYNAAVQKSRSPGSTLHVANLGPTTTATANTTTTPKRQGRWQHSRHRGRCIADTSLSQLFVLCRPFQIIEVPPIPGSLLLVWLPLVVRRRRSVRSRTQWRRHSSKQRVVGLCIAIGEGDGVGAPLNGVERPCGDKQAARQDPSTPSRALRTGSHCSSLMSSPQVTSTGSGMVYRYT